MNPKAMLAALNFLREGLSPAAISAKAASSVTKKKVAGPDVLTMRNISVDKDTPASILSMADSMTTVPNPRMVSYGQMPKNPQDIRQAKLDESVAKLELENADILYPQFRRTRNTAAGTGIGIGAIPPSLLALYLLSQQDDEE